MDDRGKHTPPGGSNTPSSPGNPPKADMPRAEAPKADMPRTDIPKAEPAKPGLSLTPANGTPAVDLSKPPPAGAGNRQAHRAELVQVGPRGSANGGAQPPAPRVRGQIDIGPDVVEKIAAASAYEVEGVADLGGDIPKALEWMAERIGIGKKDGDVGVDITGGEAEIDVTITVKYGYRILEVARSVQANVAQQAHHMLGLKVLAVNVNVEDIELPDNALSYKDDEGKKGGGSFVIES